MKRSEQARLALEIVVAYVRAQRQLRSGTIEAVVERFRCGPPSVPRRDRDAFAEALRLGRAVVRTLSLLPGDTRCLRRSLVLIQLLSRRGIPSRLVIAARTDPDFLAHAWVEYDGRPVLSPAEDSFGRLAEI